MPKVRTEGPIHLYMLHSLPVHPPNFRNSLTQVYNLIETYRSSDNCLWIVSSWARIIFRRRSLAVAVQRDNFGCNVLAWANHCDDLCLRRRNLALRALPTGLPMPLSLSVEINEDNCCGVVVVVAAVLLAYADIGAGPKRRRSSSHWVSAQGGRGEKIKHSFSKLNSKIFSGSYL